jgi:hypothetical protein
MRDTHAIVCFQNFTESSMFANIRMRQSTVLLRKPQQQRFEGGARSSPVFDLKGLKLMKSIALLLISAGLAFATPLEDLASPSQRVRDGAAGELRKSFVAPPRKAWDQLVTSIKVGDTKVSVLDRLRKIEARPAGATGSGRGSSESFRLDEAWLLWVAFAHDATKTGPKATTVTKVSLEENLQYFWVKPPEGFTGVWTTYFVNGQRSHEVHYAGGSYSGQFTSFRSDGSKACVQHYGPRGAEGEDTGYFPSGRVSYRGFHKEGKPVGTWTHYQEDGSVESTKEYPEQDK